MNTDTYAIALLRNVIEQRDARLGILLRQRADQQTELEATDKELIRLAKELADLREAFWTLGGQEE